MTAAISSISSSSVQATPFDPTKGAARIAAKVFGDLDTDKSGKLTKSEFVTGLETKGVSQDDATKQFDVIDKNKSGSVTQSDLESAIKNGNFGPPPPTRGAGGADPKGPDGAGGTGSRGPSGAGGASSAQAGIASSATKTYEAADSDQDGKVSAEEQLIYDFSHKTQSPSDNSKIGTNIDKLV